VHNKILWSQGPLWQSLTIWGWEVRESFGVLDPVISGPQEGTATTQEWVNLKRIPCTIDAARCVRSLVPWVKCRDARVRGSGATVVNHDDDEP
jgi:hypothetical protein